MDLTPRQAELADAALRIVARDGMSAVTFRTVAAESGWSVGAMQKAFASKDVLLRAMFARLRAAATPDLGAPGRPTLDAWLTELFLTIMPLDEQRRALQLQGAAFAERAAYDADIGAAVAASDDEIRGLVGALVRRAQGEGEVSVDIDPEQFAWTYLALAQGAASQLLYSDAPEPTVRARAHAAVGELLGLDPAALPRGTEPRP